MSVFSPVLNLEQQSFFFLAFVSLSDKSAHYFTNVISVSISILNYYIAFQ